MVLECFTWIPHLLCSLFNYGTNHETESHEEESHEIKSHDKGFDLLPNDTLINILSRLPTDSVFQCRRVCKHWRTLTMPSSFVELQNIRAPSVILMQQNHERYNLDFYVFDVNAFKLKTIGLKYDVTVRNNYAKLIGSSGGLLLFRVSHPTTYYDSIVLNVITGEESFITTTNGICGLFFHPSASEYKYLRFSVESNSYRYYVYSFASLNTREITSSPFLFRPPFQTFPAIVNNALHWIVDYTAIKANDVDPCKHAVMVFKMDSEDLVTLPHPSMNCKSSRNHGRMHLFVNDARLSLCHVPPCHQRIGIWVLENYANWYWVKRYSLSGLGDRENIPKKYYFCNEDPYRYMIKVLNIEKDKLLIDWFSYKLYYWDLKGRVVRWMHFDWKKYKCVSLANSLMTPSLFYTHDQ